MTNININTEDDSDESVIGLATKASRKSQFFVSGKYIPNTVKQHEKLLQLVITIHYKICEQEEWDLGH